jgi:hypothetical protein
MPDSNKESTLKKNLGDFAPKLVELTDDVLFGDVWERKELSPRDRMFLIIQLRATFYLNLEPYKQDITTLTYYGKRSLCLV